MNLISSITTLTPVSFTSWNGSQINTTITSISHQQQADHHYITVQLLVEPKVMTEILQHQWFHLSPEMILNDVNFEPEENIELQLLLMPSITNEVVKQEADAEAILMSLIPEAFGDRKLPLLTQLELWYAIEALQSIALPPELAGEGQVRQGFRTSWRQQLYHRAAAHNVKQQTEQVASRQASQSSQAVQEETAAKQSNRSLMTQVEQFLAANELKYETHDEQLIRMKLQTDNDISWTELIRIEEDARLVILYAVFPLLVDEKLREQFALQFMHENYDLVNGAFEMDMEDGELRFRSTLLCPTDVDHRSLKQLLQDHIEVMEHFLITTEHA